MRLNFIIIALCLCAVVEAQWNVISGPYSTPIFSLEYDSLNSRLYAGGAAPYIGNDSLRVNGVGYWENNEWHAMNSGLYNPTMAPGPPVRDILLLDTAVVICGEFQGVDSVFGTKGFAYWKQNNWHSFGSQNGDFGAIGKARQLALVDNNIHVLGGVDSVNSQPMYHWPIFDGTNWMPGDSTEPFSNYTHDAIRYQNDLIIAGNFLTSNGVNDIAKQGPNGWEQLGTGIYGDPWINSMVEYDGLLWVAGEFYYSPGGNPATGLMVWDGNVWSDPFPQLQRTSQSWKLKVINDVLWIVAPFTVNGISGFFTVSHYDGNQICAIRGNLEVNAFDLTASTDSLYISANPGAHVYSWPLNAPADTCFQIQVGIENPIEETSSFAIIPNPNTGQFSVACNGFDCASAKSLQVYDAAGRLAGSNSLTGLNANTTVDFSDLANGSYTVVIFGSANEQLGAVRLLIN